MLTKYKLEDFKKWLLEKPERKGKVRDNIIRKSYYNKMLRKRSWQAFLFDDKKREQEKQRLFRKSQNEEKYLTLLKMVEVFEMWINTL
jgi:hypothetical protein